MYAANVNSPLCDGEGGFERKSSADVEKCIQRWTNDWRVEDGPQDLQPPRVVCPPPEFG